MNTKTHKKAWIAPALFLGALVLTLVTALLAASIIERRGEALIAYSPQKPVRPFEPRNEIRGNNFPREYETYLKTRITTEPSGEDQLLKDPRLVVLWAGYGFSKEYNRPRGHAQAIDDIRKILRTGAPKDATDTTQPATCWTCKSPDVPRLMNTMGISAFYKGTWASLGHEVVNPIGCADCHDPATMDLVITRPALIESFNRRGTNIDNASHQEKRSLVCAQCHVEYYFQKPDQTLTFPHDKGLTVEDIESYYDSLKFADWTHALSKAPMLKAQHPDYEIWTLGIHAQRGLACADCHMPYVTEGGVKYTDHHVQSPLKMLNRTCQVCHRQSEAELTKNVRDRRNKNLELRLIAEDNLFKAHWEAKTAWDHGADAAEMEKALKLIREAQWRWDFAVAGHGSSFHAPLEVARMLSSAIDRAGQARLELLKILQKLGATNITYPDISTKEKAQQLVGIDLNKLKTAKENFMNTLVKEWDNTAKTRQAEGDRQTAVPDCASP